MKHDNKSLKRKIELYVHDLSPCSEYAMFKEKIEKLNVKDASLSNENVELKSHVSQVSEENQKLKLDMSTHVKENLQLKETVSKLIKGKQSLDQVLSILVNF